MRPCIVCGGGTPGGNRTQIKDERGRLIRGAYLCDQCAATPPDQWKRPEPDGFWHVAWHGTISVAGLAWLALLNLLPLRPSVLAAARRMMGRV